MKKTQIKVLTPAQRVAVSVATGVILMLLAGAIYIWVLPAITGSRIEPLSKAEADKLVTASRIYARSLQSRGQPVPERAPLADLVKAGLLQERDLSAFEGLDAMITLQTNEAVLTPELMRVHMGDGSDIVLRNDGTIRSELRR